MKVLLVGCNGLLGQNLLHTGFGKPDLEIAGLGIESAPTLPDSLNSYHSADIGKKEALIGVINSVKPDFIINAAAITDVDGCERNPDLCNLINRDVVGWMAATGIPLVQVSTDYVFDGVAGPYIEEDPVDPLSVYGRSKLESEALTFAGSPKSIVVRTLLLWGLGKGAKKSFTDFVRETLEAGKPVRVVTDQIGNPTLAGDLALAIWALIEKNRSGLYHVAGADNMSRFDWAVAVAAFYGLDASLIQSIITADLKQDARRPLQSGLICDKLERDTAVRPRGLQAQLEWLRDERKDANGL